MLFWLLLALSVWLGSGVVVIGVVWSMVVRRGDPALQGAPGHVATRDPGTRSQHPLPGPRAAA